MLRLSIVALLVGLGMLIWLVASRLSSDAIGVALGVVFGLLALLPASMVAAAGRRREPEERIVYRDRIIYQVATMEPEPPTRPTAQLADDWLIGCFDEQAQVQLGVSQQQVAKRGKP